MSEMPKCETCGWFRKEDRYATYGDCMESPPGRDFHRPQVKPDDMCSCHTSIGVVSVGTVEKTDG
jgi:hypothetical protein